MTIDSLRIRTRFLNNSRPTPCPLLPSPDLPIAELSSTKLPLALHHPCSVLSCPALPCPVSAVQSCFTKPWEGTWTVDPGSCLLLSCTSAVLSSQLLSPCQRSIEASVSIPCIAFTSSADMTLVRALQLTQSPAGREREAEQEKDKDRAFYDGTSARLTTMLSERARVFRLYLQPILLY
jgi:hypothetical protein